MEPDFGCRIHELVFMTQNTSAQQMVAYYVRQALESWEPRITVEDVRAASDPSRQGVLLISIGYLIRARNQRRNMVYPFYLTQG